MSSVLPVRVRVKLRFWASMLQKPSTCGRSLAFRLEKSSTASFCHESWARCFRLRMASSAFWRRARWCRRGPG